MDPPYRSAATAAIRVITKDTSGASTHKLLICLQSSITSCLGAEGRFPRSAGVIHLTPFQPITILSNRLWKVSLLSQLLEMLRVGGRVGVVGWGRGDYCGG